MPTLRDDVSVSESEFRKISAKSSSALMVDRLVGMKGAAGAGFFNASVSAIAARFAMSADDNVGIFALCGKNSTVSPMRSDAFW